MLAQQSGTRTGARAPAGTILSIDTSYFASDEFDVPLRRYMADHNLARTEALRHFAACAQFLWVCAKTTEPVAPSKKLDDAWHAFILATRQYVAYCRMNFSRYIHHAPSVPGEGKRGGYARAYTEAIRCFGAASLDTDFWPAPAQAFPTSCRGRNAAVCGTDGCDGDDAIDARAPCIGPDNCSDGGCYD